MTEDIKKARRGEILSKFMPLRYFEDFLKRKSLALVNPELWPDKNDSRGIGIYKEKTQTSYLLATCLTYASETSHHWASYGKEHGVRIIFDKKKLVEAIPPDSGYRFDNVEYLTLNDFNSPRKNLTVDKIPFYKRKGYQDEKEFRIIWSGDELEGKIKYLLVPRSSINKIVFDATVTADILNSLEDKIHLKFGSDVSVTTSTIIFSQGWIRRIKNL